MTELVVVVRVGTVVLVAVVAAGVVLVAVVVRVVGAGVVEVDTVDSPAVLPSSNPSVVLDAMIATVVSTTVTGYVVVGEKGSSVGFMHMSHSTGQMSCTNWHRARM